MVKHFISSQQYEIFEPFTSILNHTMHRILVQLGVFGVIAKAECVQAPSTTSEGAILQTVAEKVQASWSFDNKAISPYTALWMRSNELHSPCECEYGNFSLNTVIKITPQATILLHHFYWNKEIWLCTMFGNSTY